jgi:outer membrane protein assembly factor BamB
MKDNIYVGLFQKGIIAVDIATQQPLWDINFRPDDYLLSRGIPVFREGKLYHKVDQNFKEPTQKNYLMEIDLATGNMQPFLTLADSTSMSPPLLYKEEESGRELMIYNERTNIFATPGETQQRVVAIDFDTKEVVWTSEVFPDNYASSPHHPPVISKGILMTGGDWSIYGLDVHTGEILWRTKFEGQQVSIWNDTEYLIHNNRVYVNDESETVACLDPKTGNFIWRNPKGGANCTDQMFYFEKEDWLVFCSWGYGSVMILDALTGETIHREHRYDNSSYNTNVIYDEELDMFFVSTFKHAVGFKIKRKK